MTNKGKLLPLKCLVCGTKILRFFKEQEARGLFSSLQIKVPVLSNIPVIGDILF